MRQPRCFSHVLRNGPGSRLGGMQVARRRGGKKAIVALAQRLAVILHRIWADGTNSVGARRSVQQPEEGY
jgi:hypothetical protein